MSQNRAPDRNADRPSQPAKPATTVAREQRLAAALRENLKKRKAQARDQARDQTRDQALGEGLDGALDGAGSQTKPAEKAAAGPADKPRRG